MKPDLASLVAHPEACERVPREAVPHLLSELECLRARLWGRFMQPPAQPANGTRPEADRLLDVHETAAILGVDARWLYRRAKSLPFTRRPSPRTLRFSERGLRRWMETR